MPTCKGLTISDEVFVIVDGAGTLWQVDTLSATCEPVTEVTYPIHGTSYERMVNDDNLPVGVKITLNVHRDQFDSMPDSMRIEAYKAFSGMEE
jgi:hypothetical protein